MCVYVCVCATYLVLRQDHHLDPRLAEQVRLGGRSVSLRDLLAPPPPPNAEITNTCHFIQLFLQVQEADFRSPFF